MNLDVVYEGCKVWVEGRRLGQTVRAWKPVLKRTRKQIVLADDYQTRFWRATGEEIGGFHDRIVALATDEEIASYEIEKATRAARENVLAEEERQLRRLLRCYPFTLTRNGDRYEMRVVRLSVAEVQAMFAALKGVRRLPFHFVPNGEKGSGS